MQGSGAVEIEQRTVESNTSERYFPAFDGVRAIAAFLVFVCHYFLWDPGTYGVNVFLVLSGLLITGVLYDSRDRPHRFRTFYIRRSLRIFPVYYGIWLTILVLTPVMHVVWNLGLILYPLYLGNTIQALFSRGVLLRPELLNVICMRPHLHGPATPFFVVVSHFWSVSLEEQFYLMWPFVVYKIRSRRVLVQICLAAIVVVPVARLVALAAVPASPLAVWEATPLRFDEFLIGGLAALLLRSSRAARLKDRAVWLVALGAGLLVLSWVVMPHLSAVGLWRWRMTVVFAGVDGVAIGVLLLATRGTGWVVRALSWGPLRALGRISYGFYLFHMMPFFFYYRLTQRLGRHVPGLFRVVPEGTCMAAMAFCATTVLAVLSYRLVEMPFLRLKNRLAPGAARVAREPTSMHG